jgi:acetyl esterase/lipase
VTDVQAHVDLEFAQLDGGALTLDLYLPAGDASVPVVVYLHGGGWQVGDKTDGAKERLSALAERGIAIASANYRLIDAATYPAQVHDVKGAVRWLREHGAHYNLDTERVGAWGASAGAYLASMVGLTTGDAEFEGGVGGNLHQSSAVQAVVHWFGQSDLWTNSRRSWLEQEILSPPFEGPFLGVEELANHADVARAASPLYRVHAAAPPFLIAHGDHDRVTPIAQSAALHDALVRAGAESTMIVLGGAGHEGPAFDRPDHLDMTASFLKRHLAKSAP